MNTLDASMALAEWQRLRNCGLSPEERLERLMAEFFLPPIEMDVRYSDVLRAVELEMSA